MTKEEIAEKAVETLENLYPDARCSLVYRKPYELLIATRLAAQCTDARVNLVTEKLFDKYKTLEDFANADYGELCDDIRPCGFFRKKANDIIETSKILLSEYGGGLPDTMEELTKLPGVGRKTANLIMGDVFGKPAVVTDTHFIRIMGRLGLTDSKSPERVERDLRPLLPPEKSSDFCHRVVIFGRDICSARKPLCSICPMTELCREYSEK
ncbi:MAG: endonuclease III [Oscillospiraceae bacterium]|nr:endonuclease III [Oscillospiraceae bacterium]MDD6085442.1 endonuclease III [Oscillospiraceae bacterium]MDY3257448.1 endonuclease III [Ruminococcus callidus]